jgi:hypothetical protein
VLFFDYNKNFHAHPNNKIGNGGHFLSILDLEFSVQFIFEQKFQHPNRPLKKPPQEFYNKTKENQADVASLVEHKLFVTVKSTLVP